MKRILQTALATFVLTSATVAAQEKAFVDLTLMPQRTELRYVPFHSSESNVGGGRVGMLIKDCGIDARDPRVLRSTVTSTDRAEYRDGEKIRWELKLENIGTVAVVIPVSAHRSDLQPKDPRAEFRYMEMGLSPGVTSGNLGANFGNVVLYGSEASPGSTILLAPGEWIRVRAQTTVTAGPALVGPETLTGKISASVWFHDATFASTPDGSSTLLAGICPKRDGGEGTSVSILPRPPATPTEAQSPVKEN